MPKNQIKDIVLPNKGPEKKRGLLSLTREEIKKKSASDLIPEERAKPKGKPKPVIFPVGASTETLPGDIKAKEIPSVKKSESEGIEDEEIEVVKPRQKRAALIAGIVGAGTALISLLGFIATPYLSSAKIYITPRNEDIAAAYDIEAKLAPASGELGFQVISIGQIERTKEIPATKEIEVFKKAEGPIVIYNAYNSANQRLIKNTRFESPDGKIYRLIQSVVVPGASVKNGGTVPGSIEAVVSADSPGEEYNIGNADFTIPGFKGDPRYEKFYARSKPGSPITGGFAGKKKTADEKDIEAARNELKNSITEELAKTAMSQKPAEYIMYDDGMFFNFEDGDLSPKENIILKDTVSISEKGGVEIAILDGGELAKMIAKMGVPDWDGSPIVVPEMDKLDFKIKNKEKIDINQANSINFRLNGNIKVIWKIDMDSLKEKIRGAKKSLFQDVLGQFKNIKKAEAVITPFWTGKFPETPEKIKIFENF